MTGKRHPHAELIKQMADDRSLRAECPEMPDSYGLEVVMFYDRYHWNLVPPKSKSKSKTVTLQANGKTYVLPAPLTEAPAMNERCWYITSAGETGYFTYANYACDNLRLASGSAYATEADAKAWRDALREIKTGGAK